MVLEFVYFAFPSACLFAAFWGVCRMNQWGFDILLCVHIYLQPRQSILHRYY